MRLLWEGVAGVGLVTDKGLLWGLISKDAPPHLFQVAGPKLATVATTTTTNHRTIVWNQFPMMMRLQNEV